MIITTKLEFTISLQVLIYLQTLIRFHQYHKMAAVRSLCYRAIHICSSFESIINEFDSITKQFQCNKYPTPLLHK